MQILDSYQITPGCCAFCGGLHVPTVDTGRDFDVHWPAAGRMYICCVCVTELGTAFGMTSFADLTQIRADHAEDDAVNEVVIAGLTRQMESYREKYQAKAAVVDDLFDITRSTEKAST